MMEQGHIHRNGVYKPLDGRYARHGNNVRIASVCAPCCPERCVEEGGRMRPQGGGGVDHPTKVQQRKAQTESRFSLSYYPWISFAKSKSLLQSTLSSSRISSANKTPGAIGTLFSNMSNYNI